MAGDEVNCSVYRLKFGPKVGTAWYLLVSVLREKREALIVDVVPERSFGVFIYIDRDGKRKQKNSHSSHNRRLYKITEERKRKQKRNHEKKLERPKTTRRGRHVAQSLSLVAKALSHSGLFSKW
jgi:5-formaminoimidazole-4-carboxamide-1-beta-D-ribofuranosyl 5'-monophosphate synthetase